MITGRYPFKFRTTGELESLLANPLLHREDRKKVQLELESRHEGGGHRPPLQSKEQLGLFPAAEEGEKL